MGDIANDLERPITAPNYSTFSILHRAMLARYILVYVRLSTTSRFFF